MAKTKPNKSEEFHEEEPSDMYLSLLGNLSLWSVIANASSYGKSGRVEAGRCIARTSLYKYVSLLSRLYIFIVAENPAIQSCGCYEVARKHGKPIVIMEPIKGGMLANPPESVAKVFTDANPDVSLASWAIRFAASLDGVITVLSGMSTLDQMKDNVAYMENFKQLDDSERATVEEARKVLAGIPIIPCTTCNYCAKVCPQNIGISGSFTAFNVLTLYKNKTFAANQYRWLVEMHGKEYADKCIKCGRCEAVCPQHIPIRANLVKVAAAFGKR